MIKVEILVFYDKKNIYCSNANRNTPKKSIMVLQLAS